MVRDGLVIWISVICMGMLPILGPIQLAIQNDTSFLVLNGLFAFLVTLTLASSYEMILSLGDPVLVLAEHTVYAFSLQLSALMTPIIMNFAPLVIIFFTYVRVFRYINWGVL